MKKLFKILAFAILLPAFLVCTEKIAAQGWPQFIELHRGYYTVRGNMTQRQTKVITSQEDYAANLAVYSNDAPHQLDFSAGKVLLVDMGPRSSGGFNIEVVSVIERRRSGAVVANVSLTKPGYYCVVTTAITNPYQFVYIRTTREILVSESLGEYECEAFPAMQQE